MISMLPVRAKPGGDSGALAQLSREFMPAAIELEQTPSSPWARGILWTIMALFVAAVVWAVVGKVDVVAVAEGSLVPSGRTKAVQPSQLGRVSAIHVQDGDLVSADEPLITLDGTETNAEVRRLREALEFRTKRADRLSRWVDFLTGAIANTGKTTEASDGVLAESTQDRVLQSRLQALRVSDAALRQRREAKKRDLDRVQAMTRRLERTLPLINEHTEAIRALSERDLASRVEWLDRQRALIEAEGRLQEERHRRDQIQAEVAALEHQRHQLWTDALEEALSQRESLRAEIQELQQQLIQAQARNRVQVLRSPVDGIVHNLQLNTVGGVVQAAEPVVEIIPRDERVIAEAWVLNRDIGFVHEGQEASLKVNAFKFTKYGTIPGKVIHLSRDAVVDEQAGARYLARIALETDAMDVGDHQVKLSPGMTITAEVSTGQRRLIEFVTAPIVEAMTEAGRER